MDEIPDRLLPSLGIEKMVDVDSEDHLDSDHQYRGDFIGSAFLAAIPGCPEPNSQKGEGSQQSCEQEQSDPLMAAIELWARADVHRDYSQDDRRDRQSGRHTRLKPLSQGAMQGSTRSAYS